MSDVIVIVVPHGDGAYPTVNAISDHGATRGRKSGAYLDMFRAARESARAAMATFGWETATGYLDGSLTVIRNTKRRIDAPNTGKVEFDAFRPSTPNEIARDRSEPFAGVYADDSQFAIASRTKKLKLKIAHTKLSEQVREESRERMRAKREANAARAAKSRRNRKASGKPVCDLGQREYIRRRMEFVVAQMCGEIGLSRETISATIAELATADFAPVTRRPVTIDDLAPLSRRTPPLERRGAA